MILEKEGQQQAIYFPPILEVIMKHLAENWSYCSIVRNWQIRTMGKRPRNEDNHLSPLTIIPV